MKPHPRIRKTIKWGGAAVTVLLVVVWIGSGSLGAVWTTKNRWAIGVMKGRFLAWETSRHIPNSDVPGIEWFAIDPYAIVWHSEPHWSDGRTYCIPLWLPVGASAAITAGFWRLDILARRRAKLNLCLKCGYDRAGLASGAVCPECGSPDAANK